ncbi:MAG: hypothetical protein ACO3ME_08835 [Ilumatobacteraceae bacterium]|nr:hypothetical protein [Gammaproteobacteria bacterium]
MTDGARHMTMSPRHLLPQTDIIAAAAGCLAASLILNRFHTISATSFRLAMNTICQHLFEPGVHPDTGISINGHLIWVADIIQQIEPTPRGFRSSTTDVQEKRDIFLSSALRYRPSDN